MNKERFEELSQAIRQARAVRRGEAAPSRVWEVARGKNGKLQRRQLDPTAYQHERRSEWENTVADTRSSLNGCRPGAARGVGAAGSTLQIWRTTRFAT
jgi:hypothetical protein